MVMSNQISHVMTKSQNKLCNGDDAPTRTFIFDEPKPLLFSKTELFVASGADINVYNPLGGKLIYVLKGHEHKVISVCRSQQTSENINIISCDEKANIFYWSSDRKCSDNVPSITLPLGKVTISHFSIFNDTYAVSYLSAKTKKVELCMVRPPYVNQKCIRTLSSDIIPGQNKIAVSYDGKYLAAIKHRELVIEFFANRTMGKPFCHMTGEHLLTCLAFHPSKDMLATGNSRGAVMLWFQIVRSRPVKVILHWHTMPVRDLCFSSMGGELYSGGDECVLVRWNLNDDNRRSFLPRLGMPIRAIQAESTDSYMVLHQQDHALNIVNMREMLFEGAVHKMSLHVPVHSQRPLPAGILFHHPTSNLVKNGRTGHLQFFYADRQTRSYDLDISLCNFATQERHKNIPNPEIVKAAVSADGAWLVTSEVCHLSPSIKEINIKFWNFIRGGVTPWEVNTSVQTPHTDSVTSLCIHGCVQDPACVSCSEDGTFKIWRLVTYQDLAGKTRRHWNSRFSREYRGLAASASAFASDGSLLAVAFENVVTLWTPEEALLVATLSQSFIVDRIVDLVFSHPSYEGAALVSRSDTCLCSWDLLSCSLQWRVFLRSTCLAVDPKSSLIAVFSKKSEVFYVEPNSSQPVGCARKVSDSEVICALFAPYVPLNSKKRAAYHRLYCFDSKQNFLSLEHPRAANARHFVAEPKKEKMETEERTSGMFSALVAKSRHRVPLKEEEDTVDVSLQAPSVNNLLKDIKDLNVPSINFVGLLDHMMSFIPDLRKESGSLGERTSDYTTIELDRKKERRLAQSSALKEEALMEAIEKFDTDLMVQKLQS